MALKTSSQSGLASATSTWGGAAIPVEGDQVVIAAGHTVTIDGTYVWGHDVVSSTYGSSAVNVAGTLKASRTVSSSLTFKGSAIFNSATNATFDYGTIADPIPSSVNATVLLNKAGTGSFREGMRFTAPAGAGQSLNFYTCGAKTRTRWVLTAADIASGQANITLSSSAHGWVAGDTIMVGTAPASAVTVNQQETMTILSVSGAVITCTTNFTYLHKTGIPVANYNSNVTIKSFNASPNNSYIFINQTISNYPQNVSLNDTAFWYMGYGVGNPILFTQASNNLYPMAIDRCAFYQTSGQPCPVVYGGKIIVSMTNSVFANNMPCGQNSEQGVGFSIDGCSFYGWNMYYYNVSPTSSISNSWIEMQLNCPNVVTQGAIYKNVKFYGSQITYFSYQSSSFYNCDFGYSYPVASQYGDSWTRYAGTQNLEMTVYFKDCKFGTTWNTPASYNGDLAAQMNITITYENKNADITQQEVWNQIGTVIRNNSTTYRGTSSYAFTPYKYTNSLNKDLTKTISIPCANGSTIRVLGYIKADTTFYNSGTWNAPKMTLSGLGATPVVFTATSAANNAWQQGDISITNSSGADGNFTLTLSANSQTTAAGSVYFDGIPDGLFVTKVRHYGFDLSQQTSATRTVDPYVVVSESTAAAYTGVTFNGSTKRITFGAGTIDTAQKIYDYSRAWSCLNLTYDIPLARSGGLYALASGWTVVDPTILGQTWSGGTVEFNSTGVKYGDFDTTTISFKTAGTYNLSNCTFSGNINLSNASGGAVTVNIPSGVTYTNLGPSLTVSAPVVTVSLTLTGLSTDDEVWLYKASDMSLLASANPTGSTTFTYSYTYSADIPSYLVIFSLSYQPMYIPITLINSNNSIPIQQVVDRNYSNP